MLSAIFYGLRIRLGVGVARAVIALAHRPRDRARRRVFRRPVRALIMRHRRHPAFVSGDPDRADPDRGAGAGLGKVIIALVTVQWAYYARTVRGAALVENAQGIHRGGALPRAVAGAHRASGTCCRTACRR